MLNLSPMKPSRNHSLWKAAAAPLLMALTVSCLLPATGFSAEKKLTATASDISLAHEVQRSIDRGLEFLAKQQSPEGFWAPADHPAMTALALSAIQGDPSGTWPKKEAAKVKQGYDFILKNLKEDGSIHDGKLITYNTSVSLMALVLANDPALRPAIAKARQFLVNTQLDVNEKGKTDSPVDGGFGYGNTFDKGDMSNTYLALQALYYSRAALKDGGDKVEKDLNWEAAINFLQNCQDLPKKGDATVAENKGPGGFVYRYDESKAGSVTNAVTGKVTLRTYGTMTYAGLLSYIYADMKKDDPRVLAAQSWLESNYSLKENPGLEAQGLYYYYHLMAKALNMLDTDYIKTADGKMVNWRKDLALHLLNQQKTDGSWVNEANGRWWEKEPPLVTAYSVMALEMVHSGLVK
jgi:squalene-hopene/tetraprenyl-beta-curcumene cyclase